MGKGGGSTTVSAMPDQATQDYVRRMRQLAMGYAVPTLANPQDYPQFAQQQEDPSIPITFIGVKVVKQQFDAGRRYRHATSSRAPVVERRWLASVQNRYGATLLRSSRLTGG